MPEKRISLITRADDFGATPGSNNGILAALEGGVVRNVGIMACGPFLERRLDELHDHDLCLGIHATLTSEWEGLRWGPVLPTREVPSLVELDSSFPRQTRVLAERCNPGDMIREIRAQLNHLRCLGLPIRYLDTHMGFTWVHDMDERLSILCREEGLVYGNDARFAHMKCQLSAPSHPGPEQLRAGQTGDAPAVWVFHPALSDATYTFPPEIAEERAREARRLADTPAISSLFTKAGFTPVRYDEV